MSWVAHAVVELAREKLREREAREKREKETLEAQKKLENWS